MATTPEFTLLLMCGVWGRLPRHTISWKPDHEAERNSRPLFDLHLLVRDGSDGGLESAGKTRAAQKKRDAGEESPSRSANLDRGLERIVGSLCETAVRLIQTPYNGMMTRSRVVSVLSGFNCRSFN